jgi:hypothetical protein
MDAMSQRKNIGRWFIGHDALLVREFVARRQPETLRASCLSSSPVVQTGHDKDVQRVFPGLECLFASPRDVEHPPESEVNR